MSKSSFMISLQYAMLEGRKACVPGYEDSSGGHTIFKYGPAKLRSWGPDSNVFDGLTWGLHGETLSEEYDEEALVEKSVKQIIADLTAGDNHLLKTLVRSLFQQAKQHCDEHHKDIREKYKNDKDSD